MEILDYAWEPSMRTGDDLCDAQHKELIRRLNLLLHAMYKGQPAAEVESMLDFLSKYVVQHFSREEALMDRVQCPLAAANRKAHAIFMKKLATFRDRLANRQSTTALIAIEMLRDISTWLVDHIRNIDARMLPYVQQQGATP
ncbi:MAG: hemerythrin family protein [Chloroflexi bacterium]|nr:hemerythrin family protein [Chloroflexota bacterium]